MLVCYDPTRKKACGVTVNLRPAGRADACFTALIAQNLH